MGAGSSKVYEQQPNQSNEVYERNKQPGNVFGGESKQPFFTSEDVNVVQEKPPQNGEKPKTPTSKYGTM